MPAHGSRLPKSEATRIRLLDCAVQEIAESGPDRVGFTSIARRAGTSTGALYARYENSDELLVDVWLQRCLPELRRVLAELGSAVSGENEAAVLSLAARISPPDPVLLVTARLLVAARRNDTLWEVVNPSFRETVGPSVARFPGMPFGLASVFGYLIGSVGSGLTNLDWVGPLSFVVRSVPSTQPRPVPRTDYSGKAETPFEPVGDDIDSRLFRAMSMVIGKVGVEKATISRIARMAGVNPATIYMRYEDKDALLDRAVTLIAEMGVSRNRELIDAFGSEGSVDSGIEAFRGNATDGYADVRRLRLETMMASGCHDRLCAVTRRIYVETANVDAKRLGMTEAARDPKLMPFVVFMRFAFFGHALLREYGYLAEDDPHVETLLRDLFGRLGRAAAATVPGNSQKSTK